MAISDIGIELWKSSTGSAASYTKFLDITSVPASGSTPEKFEKTVMSDTRKTYVSGRIDSPDQTFEYNYDDATFTTVSAVCGTSSYFLVVLSDGSGTYIKGVPTTYKNDVALGSIVKATFVIVPEDIDDKTIVEVTALKDTGS